MNAINVKKSELLDVLRKNREQHRKIFLEAQESYRTAVIKELDFMLEEARSGRRIKRAVELTEPVDQTREYDRVIRMMEMSVDETIPLEEHEFRCYVLDEWGWKASFLASNRHYSKTLQDAEATP